MRLEAVVMILVMIFPSKSYKVSVEPFSTGLDFVVRNVASFDVRKVASSERRNESSHLTTLNVIGANHPFLSKVPKVIFVFILFILKKILCSLSRARGTGLEGFQGLYPPPLNSLRELTHTTSLPWIILCKLVENFDKEMLGQFVKISHFWNNIFLTPY